jgi:uncharacterized membrane protein
MRESVPSGVLTSVLRPAIIASSIVWALLLPLAPFVAARLHPTPAVVAFLYAVYLTGSGICHQLPERSFELWGRQMPVCARCAGIYLGAALAVIVVLLMAPMKWRSMDTGAGRRFSAGFWRVVLGIAATPALISLLYEWTTGQMPSNWIRAATGVPLGAMVAWMVMWATAPGHARRIR